MAIQRWDPVRDLVEMQQKINQLFEATFSRSAGAARHATRSAAQAAALAKCNRQRCPRLSSLRRVPFPSAVRHKRRLPARGPFAELALTLGLSLRSVSF